MSFENAEQWIKDAKLLIKNSSFGHASALLRFACEEIAKAYVCWLTSEEIIPKDNKIVKDVFFSHWTKNQVILGLLLPLISNFKKKEIRYEDDKQLQEQIANFNEFFEKLVVSTNEMRNKAIYVDIHKETKKVTSPLKMDEKEARAILQLTERILQILKPVIQETTEIDKEKFRKTFSKLPKDVWKTGEIPIQWLIEKGKNIEQ